MAGRIHGAGRVAQGLEVGPAGRGVVDEQRGPRPRPGAISIASSAVRWPRSGSSSAALRRAASTSSRSAPRANVDDRLARAGVAGVRRCGSPSGASIDEAPGRDVVPAAAEPDRQGADAEDVVGVVLGDLEGVVEERRPLARSRPSSGIEPGAPAGRQVDGQAARRPPAPREEVAQRDEVEVVVGVHVADDDRRQRRADRSRRSSRRMTPWPQSRRSAVVAPIRRGSPRRAHPGAGTACCSRARSGGGGRAGRAHRVDGIAGVGADGPRRRRDGRHLSAADGHRDDARCDGLGALPARRYDARDMLARRPLVDVAGRRPVLRRASTPPPSSGSPPGCGPRRFRRGEIDLPRRRPGRRAVHHRVRARSRSRCRPRPATRPSSSTLATGRRLRRAGPARRRARARRRRPPSSATETVVLPRDRFRELIATEPAIRDALLASLAGGAAPADQPRRGAPLPRHHRPPGRAPRPAGRRGRHRSLPDGAIRLRDAADPGRPRGDDRLHPPEREQAPRPVHRRRPDPARRDGIWSPTSRPDGGVPPIGRGSAAGPRRRRPRPSASSRIAAAVEGRRASRPVGPVEEHEPPLAMDLAIGRRRRRPTPPCRRGRGRARTARPTSAPPSSRARARVAHEVIGDRVVVRRPRPSARRRRRRAREPSPPARRARSTRRSGATARRRTAPRAPARADLDDGERPAERLQCAGRSRSPRSSRRSPRRRSPSRLEDRRRGRLHEVLGRRRRRRPTAEIRTSTASTRA